MWVCTCLHVTSLDNADCYSNANADKNIVVELCIIKYLI